MYCNKKDSKMLDKLFAHLTAQSCPAMYTLTLESTHVGWNGAGLVAVTAPIRELSVSGGSMLGERFEHLSHMTALTSLRFKFNPYDRHTVNLSGAVSKLASLQQLRVLQLSPLHSTRGLGALTQLSRLEMHFSHWTPDLPVSQAAFLQGMALAGEPPLTALKSMKIHASGPPLSPGDTLAALDFGSAVPALEDLELSVHFNGIMYKDATPLQLAAAEHMLAALPHLHRLRMFIWNVPTADLPPLVVGGRRWRRTVDCHHVVHKRIDT